MRNESGARVRASRGMVPIIAGALAAIALAAASPSPATAQSDELTVEAGILRGTAGYAWPAAERVYFGVEVGFGFPQVDITLVPERDEFGGPDLLEIFHIAALVRYRLSDNFEVDAGLRTGIGELWGCSGCFPPPLVAAYVQPMFGWRRVKIGPRLLAGWIGEREPAGPDWQGPGDPPSTDGWTGVVNLSPVNVRVTIPVGGP